MRILEVGFDRPLREPVLVICLNGWVNAGGVATLVADTLGGDKIGEGRSDLLFDYRVSRPVLDFVDGVMTSMVWPELVIRRLPLDEWDLLVMSGVEPNWNWRQLGAELSELAIEWKVRQQISIGGVPWAWPHTREVPIISAASDQSLLADNDDHARGLLRVPAAAVSALDFLVAGAGVPTVGFYARVPQYVNVAYPAAALAVIRRLERHLEHSLPTGDLAESADAQRKELDTVASQRPDLAEAVQKLESMVDATESVSGEQLAAEIERFLRERGDQQS
ncbi:MAG: proteasome assembly chaperone family protein [Acidimicrobiia bacterium]